MPAPAALTHPSPVMPEILIDPQLRTRVVDSLLATMGLDLDPEHDTPQTIHHSHRVVMGAAAVLEEGFGGLSVASIMRCHPYLVSVIAQLVEVFGVWRSDPTNTGPLEEFLQDCAGLNRPEEVVTFDVPFAMPSRPAYRLAEAVMAVMEMPGSVQVPLSTAVPPALSTEQATAYYFLLALSRGDDRLSLHGLLERDPTFVMFFGGLWRIVAAYCDAAPRPDATDDPVSVWCDEHGSRTLAELRSLLQRAVPADATECGAPHLVVRNP